MPKMIQYPNIKSIGSIGSSISGFLEVQIDYQLAASFGGSLQPTVRCTSPGQSADGTRRSPARLALAQSSGGAFGLRGAQAANKASIDSIFDANGF